MIKIKSYSMITTIAFDFLCDPICLKFGDTFSQAIVLFVFPNLFEIQIRSNSQDSLFLFLVIIKYSHEIHL